MKNDEIIQFTKAMAHLNLLGSNFHFILDQGLPQRKFSSTQIIMHSLQNMYMYF